MYVQNILQPCCVGPVDWRSNILLPVFKGKGDPMECGSYRAIKLYR